MPFTTDRWQCELPHHPRQRDTYPPGVCRTAIQPIVMSTICRFSKTRKDAGQSPAQPLGTVPAGPGDGPCLHTPCFSSHTGVWYRCESLRDAAGRRSVLF